MKSCQLAASPRGEAAEVQQTLPDTERLTLNSLYNALDLRFDQKYFKDYARLQMKTRLQKTGESLQEYDSEVERLANLAFFQPPSNCARKISLQYFVDGLKDEEIQKTVRMADVKDLKSALLSALKLEPANEASCRDRRSIHGARVTVDAPYESPCMKKLKEGIQDLMAQPQNKRWRDGQVCPDVDKELWRLGPDDSGVFWRWASVFRCRQGTMAPWARRLGCVLKEKEKEEVTRKERSRKKGQESPGERTDGERERRKETERESGRERESKTRLNRRKRKREREKEEKRAGKREGLVVLRKRRGESLSFAW
ncbi:uncharacterized protein TNCV_3197321 [Trichonephila clavipes]|nr:uncharacterized protein TNCV_3197321 [Trichonephila clavipes]